MSAAPVYRDVEMGRYGQRVTQQVDGSMLIESEHALLDYPARLLDKLVHWAKTSPSNTFLARRSLVNGVPNGDWQRLSYAQVLEDTRRVGSALLHLGLSEHAPIAILSENDLDHARLALAAMYVGIPYTPVSVPYSLQSQDHSKIKHIVRLLKPGMIFVSDAAKYTPAVVAALKELQLANPGQGCVVVASRNGAALTDAGIAWVSFEQFLATQATPEVDAAFAATGPDTIAKFLFTSGSTKMPKAVINTQRMMSANQQMILQSLPFLGKKAPVLMDWLPWNHTFGGNHNFGIALYNGGALYIDDGKPMPGLVDISLKNLKEIAPTIYFNVPKGYEALSMAMQKDDVLRSNFFSQLDLMMYAGASLPPAVWQAMYELAEKTLDGQRVPMITSLGMTESAPAFFIVNRTEIKPGEVGVVMPGVTLKLVPVGDKLEGHYRGPTITPGYWNSPQDTAANIDANAWLNSGDAFLLVDSTKPELGFRFNGRTSDDFKLLTGTWVSASSLKAKIAQNAAPYVSDCIIIGADRDSVRALVVPNTDALRTLDPDALAGKDQAQVLRHDKVQAWFSQLLTSLNHGVTGSADKIAAIGIIEGILSLDKGEVTDKGSLNANAIQKARGALIEDLFIEDLSSSNAKQHLIIRS